MMMDDVEKVLFTKERLAAKAAELGIRVLDEEALLSTLQELAEQCDE